MANKDKVEKIAVILIRGRIGLDSDRKKTLDLLNLYRKNYCVILPKNKVVLGMLNKVKDYVTWGELDDEVLQLLEKKREGKKKFIRLAPPLKGFERGGIKKSFKQGGALGYRGKNINDLLKRMIR